LIRRWLEALAALDPGGIRLARGVHFLLITVASGLAAMWVQNLLDIPDSPLFAVLSGAVALNAFICSPAGTRRSESIMMLKNFGIALAVFALGLVIGWRELGYGAWPVELAWIAAIVFGLYLRRYGPAASQYGLMTTFMFMFVTLANPTRQMALWLLLGVIVAAVTTLVVHKVVWRPSALASLKRQALRLCDTVAAELNACLRGTSSTVDQSAHEAWDKLTRAAQLALAEAPGEWERLKHLNATGLRLLMALKVVVEAAGQTNLDRLSESERGDFDRVYDVVTASLTKSLGDVTPGDDPRQAALAKTRDDIIADRAMPRTDKFQWLRQVIGLMRMIVSADELRRTISEFGAATGAALSSPAAGSTGPDTRGMGWRLALQGFVAAGTTVALALIFQLDHAYWATMTVFIVLSANLGATLKRTIERAIGTTIGVVIAVAGIVAIGDDLVVQIVLVSLATIPIFVLMERHYMVTAGLIGFVVVLAMHMVEGVGVDGMLSRLYQTGIGASLALASAWLVFPIRAVDNVRPLIRKLLDDCHTALISVRDGADLPAVNVIQRQADAQALANELVNLNSERVFARRQSADSARLEAHADALTGYLALYLQTLLSMKSAKVSPTVQALQRELTDRIAAELSNDLEPSSQGPDVNSYIERWQTAAPLDGRVPSADVLTMIEQLYYGRKLIDTLTGLKSALAALHV